MTREFPPKIRKQYGLEDIPIWWLTDADSDEEEIIKPTRLSFEITREMSVFMKGKPPRAILIHGIEYMIHHLSFKEVMTWLQKIRDQTSISDSILLVVVDPNAIEDKEFNNISVEFTKLEK